MRKDDIWRPGEPKLENERSSPRSQLSCWAQQVQPGQAGAGRTRDGVGVSRKTVKTERSRREEAMKLRDLVCAHIAKRSSAVWSASLGVSQ